MKHTYTKGDWTFFSNTYHNSYNCGVTIDGANDIALCSGFDSDRPRLEEEANARLIAAAPDLLDSLKDMIQMYEEVEPAGGYQGFYEAAVTAVNKAQGE